MNQKILALQDWLKKQPGVNLNVGLDLIDQAIKSDNSGLVNESELFRVASVNEDFFPGDFVKLEKGTALKGPILQEEVDVAESTWVPFFSKDCSLLFVAADYTGEEDEALTRIYVYNVENYFIDTPVLSLKQTIELGPRPIDGLLISDDNKTLVLNILQTIGEEGEEENLYSCQIYLLEDDLYRLVENVIFPNHIPTVSLSPSGKNLLVYKEFTSDEYDNETIIFEINKNGLRELVKLESPSEDHEISKAVFLDNTTFLLLGIDTGETPVNTVFVGKINNNVVSALSVATLDLTSTGNLIDLFPLSATTFICTLDEGEDVSVGEIALLYYEEGVYYVENVQSLIYDENHLTITSFAKVQGCLDFIINTAAATYYAENFKGTYVITLLSDLPTAELTWSLYGMFYAAVNIETDELVLESLLNVYTVYAFDTTIHTISGTTSEGSFELGFMVENVSEVSGDFYWKVKKALLVSDTRAPSGG